MSWASDDLTPVLAAQPAGPGVSYRQGIIRAWNPATAENTVEVDGVLFDNLSILNTNEALQLTAGDVVGILTTGSAARSWAILGRLTIPGTVEAASALSMVRTYADRVTFLEATTSTSFTDLATVGPTLTPRVGSSGRLLVMVTCLFDYNGNDTQGGGYMAYNLAGPTSRPANEFTSLKSVFNASDPSADTVSWVKGDRMTAVSLEEGLAPGDYTLTAKYKAFAGGCNFGDRVLTAIPL